MEYIQFLICGVISVALGMLWFGPLFGKQYMKYCGVTDEMQKEMSSNPAKKAEMNAQMMRGAAIAFVANILTAVMLSGAIGAGQSLYNISDLHAALFVPFFNWLGFVVPPTLGMVLWENKKWGHWFLIAAFWLVYMVLAGLVIVYL